MAEGTGKRRAEEADRGTYQSATLFWVPSSGDGSKGKAHCRLQVPTDLDCYLIHGNISPIIKVKITGQARQPSNSELHEDKLERISKDAVSNKVSVEVGSFLYYF